MPKKRRRRLKFVAKEAFEAIADLTSGDPTRALGYAERYDIPTLSEEEYEGSSDEAEANRKKFIRTITFHARNRIEKSIKRSPERKMQGDIT